MFFNEDAGLASAGASEFYKRIASVAMQKKFLSMVGFPLTPCTGFEPNYSKTAVAIAMGSTTCKTPDPIAATHYKEPQNVYYVG